MRRSAVCALLAAAVSTAGGLTAMAPADADAPAAADTPAPGDPTVLVSGLNNPRQLALLGGRGLLIAEAGRGMQTGVCAAASSCGGGTGSISLIGDVAAQPPIARRIVSGLLSFADPDGGSAVGPDGVSARSLTMIYIAMTDQGGVRAAARRPARPIYSDAGKLLVLRAGRTRIVAADISAVEEALNPDGGDTDSDPYGVLVLPDGGQLVADAGGNDILAVRGSHVSVFAVLPDHDGHHAMPTSLALDPDGAIRVGELNGQQRDTARIWRLSRGGDILDWIGGLSTVTGVAVGADGTVYASEMTGGDGLVPGQVTAIRRDNGRVHYPVPFPAGIAVDTARHLYVSAWSISDSDGISLGHGITSPPGQVWRLTG
ncbi:MAG: hypothetical protein V7637_535 [Mycobacteriales bacterium]